MALPKYIQIIDSSIKNVFRCTYILFLFCVAQLQQSETVEVLKIWGEPKSKMQALRIKIRLFDGTGLASWGKEQLAPCPLPPFPPVLQNIPHCKRPLHLLHRKASLRCNRILFLKSEIKTYVISSAKSVQFNFKTYSLAIYFQNIFIN